MVCSMQVLKTHFHYSKSNRVVLVPVKDMELKKKTLHLSKRYQLTIINQNYQEVCTIP